VKTLLVHRYLARKWTDDTLAIELWDYRRCCPAQWQGLCCAEPPSFNPRAQLEHPGDCEGASVY
jgi:hypothetical protein